MSWASRRRTIYGTGVTLFFVALIGVPLMYWYLTIPATCSDGKQNQGETAIDRGGPCPLLDERALSPYAILWSRSFRVRDGSYNAVAYVQNPNEHAGVREVSYRFGLYDANNILVAERTGTTYIMPAAITPIFEGNIDTGNRTVARTYFEFTDPLTWKRLDNTAEVVDIGNREITGLDTAPRITAVARNTGVKDLKDVSFVAVVFDPAGNAFAASHTTVPSLAGEGEETVVFTWPDPFGIRLGSVDITPLSAPTPPKATP